MNEPLCRICGKAKEDHFFKPLDMLNVAYCTANSAIHDGYNKYEPMTTPPQVMKEDKELALAIRDKCSLGYVALSTIEEAVALIRQKIVAEKEAEIERQIYQLVDERDSAERAISQAYYLATGNSPEWSNNFGHSHALNDIDEALCLLKETVKGHEAKLTTMREALDAAEKAIHSPLQDENHNRLIGEALTLIQAARTTSPPECPR